MTANETAIVATRTAVEKLNRSLAATSLDDLVKAKTRRSLLLVDASGSMGERIRSGERKIDALRKVVTGLQSSHRVPVAAFGVRTAGQVEVVDVVPEPSGSTPIDLAIEFGKDQGANHLIVVTDGQPNNAYAAFEAAKRFDGPIDTFYIGDGRDGGAEFAAELARMTGGTFGVTDLGKPKELAAKLAGLLGDGSDMI